jgi:thiol-disulfide isomerase/thioredoxin
MWSHMHRSAELRHGIHVGGLAYLKGEPLANVPTKTGPMVIEFWASWCGPCRMAFPHLSELQRKYKDKGLVVLGISLEEDSPQTR